MVGCLLRFCCSRRSGRLKGSGRLSWNAKGTLHSLTSGPSLSIRATCWNDIMCNLQTFSLKNVDFSWIRRGLARSFRFVGSRQLSHGTRYDSNGFCESAVDCSVSCLAETSSTRKEGLMPVGAVLSALGLCSRGEGDYFLKCGLVMLDGRPLKPGEAYVQPNAALSLAPRATRVLKQHKTVLLCKPMHYLACPTDRHVSDRNLWSLTESAQAALKVLRVHCLFSRRLFNSTFGFCSTGPKLLN